MQFNQRIKDTILNNNDFSFTDTALEVFEYQALKNPLYKEYLSYLKVSVNDVKQLTDIPFLPIEFFKHHDILCEGVKPRIQFQSSGTTGSITSKHLVADPEFYQLSSQHAFEKLYGKLSDLHILALLPNYLEKGESSLVHMVDHFIKHAKQPSGFYLYEYEKLCETIKELKAAGEKILLIGVTFALLDLSEQYSIDLSDCILMETGGMKGRRKEMLRSEIHTIFKNAFNLKEIHSEYGMTELLSQAYSKGQEIFEPASSLKLLFREINDPFSVSASRKSGGINIIDLANIDSCCFIETKDIGGTAGNDTFKVLGRYDNSDIRGCNLMVQ
ncbi:acyl transferase [Limibacter armeniacum]|uniref:acyl transferase n=1 Tax=Limibacter armeniacum TaxID=466084 RepID=UPI002FE5D215